MRAIMNWRSVLMFRTHKFKCPPYLSAFWNIPLNSPLNISSTTLEIWFFFSWFNVIYVIGVYFLPFFCLLHIFESQVIQKFKARSTTHLNLLRCVWRCLHAPSFILNRVSLFARNSCFADLSDPSWRLLPT